MKGPHVPLSRLGLYAQDVYETAQFYEKHFGFKAKRLPGDRIVELMATGGGGNLMLHPAIQGQRRG